MKELIIELTNRCLNNCIHCSSKNCGADSEVHDMSLIEIEPVVNKALSDGYSRVVFSGGEPLLHPNFCDIVDYFVNKHVELKMYTSGVANNIIYTSDKYVKTIGKIKTITVSCYSVDADKHNFIVRNSRGHAYLQKFIRTFSHVIDQLEMNFVPMSFNTQETNSTYEHYKDILASYNVLKLVRQGNAATIWERLRANDALLKNELMLLNSKKHTKIGNSFGLISNSSYFCEAGTTKMCITFDGYIIPCEVFKASRKQFKHFTEYTKDISMFSTDTHRYSQHNYSRGCQAHSICL